MSKVKFGENDSRIVELQATASLERQQADDATRKHTRILRRLRAFYEAIEYVSFRSADEAPIWASNWLDWLIDGVMIVPDELVDAETASADQPAPDMDEVLIESEVGLVTEEITIDDPDPEPDPPVAATG